MTSIHRSGNEILSKDPVKRKSFWDGSKREAPKVAKVTKAVSRASTFDHPPWLNHSAKYAVYSAQVTTTPSKDLFKGLRAMTKKDPPSHFDFEMVYVSLPVASFVTLCSSRIQFSKEEQDARTAEEKLDPDMGSIFRGPQGLFPQLDGYAPCFFVSVHVVMLSSCFREYMSRIFIVSSTLCSIRNCADESQGQSTAQTTGIGGHMSGRFIPTVERGSIDLTWVYISCT